jgi:hypothetical protein
MIYLAQSYREYFIDTSQNIYKSKRVEMPRPELYVILTKERKNQPEYISLSEEFFGGEMGALEVRAKIIYDGEKGDIISQYINFTRVLDEQIKLHGRTIKAATEAIRICSDRDILKEYLKARRKEVIDIMKLLMDQETATEMYLKDEKIQTAIQFSKMYGKTKDETVKALVETFNLKKHIATHLVTQHWDDFPPANLTADVS